MIEKRRREGLHHRFVHYSADSNLHLTGDSRELILDVPSECRWSTEDIFELDSARVQPSKDQVESLYDGTACVLLRISIVLPNQTASARGWQSNEQT